MNHFKLYNNWNTKPLFQYLKMKYLFNYKIDHVAYRSFNKKNLMLNYEKEGYKLQPEKYNFINHNANALWLKNEKI